MQLSGNKKLSLFLLLFISFTLNLSCTQTKQNDNKINIENKEIVVLLHGILRSNKNMAKLEQALINENYIVLNISYPSSKYSIENLIDTVYSLVQENLNNNYINFTNNKINYVGYSMGGLIAKGIASRHPENLGKVILIGTPSSGSEIADDWQNNWLYKFLFGPAGQQLTTENIKKLDPIFTKINYPLGVIAGTSNEKYDKWGSDLSVFNGVVNDGRVSVNSAKVLGMTDYIEIFANHYRLPNNNETIKQVIYFLKNSKFEKTKSL